MCVIFEEASVGIEHVSAKLCIKIDNISGISNIMGPAGLGAENACACEAQH
jgi:hypothetical protein